MSTFWFVVGRLGEAQILLPAVVAVALWLGWRTDAPRMTAWWIGAVSVAALLTTLTKVAFIGWGIGYAPLNFTGVSGHAAFAAAILPLLARAAVPCATAQWQGAAMVAAYALAVLIAVQRVVTGAHSPSEAAGGFALGAAASGMALGLAAVPRVRVPRAVLVGLLAWMLATPAAAPPSRTHDWVTTLSLALSGRDAPYTRRMMLRQWRERERASHGAP